MHSKNGALFLLFSKYEMSHKHVRQSDCLYTDRDELYNTPKQCF